jgi:WD40 repeat protein
MLLLGGLAAFFIVSQVEEQRRKAEESAMTAEDKRRVAESEATRLSGVADEARTKQQEADRKAKDAEGREADAVANAATQQQLAVAQKRLADEQTRRAEEQTKLADAQQQRSQRLTYIGNMQLAQQLLDAGNTQSGQRLLNGFLPTASNDEKSKVDHLRGYEWYHLWRIAHRKTANVPMEDKPAGPDSAPARPGQYTMSKVSDVNSIVFSPSSKHLVTADNKGLKLWNTTNDLSPTLISRFDGQFRSLSYSRFGNQIAAISGSSVRVFAADTLSPVTTIAQPNGKDFQAMAFSSLDDTLLATADESGVYFWRITGNTSNRMIETIPSPGVVSSMTFSRDGNQLGLQTEERVQIFSIAFQRLINAATPRRNYFNGSLLFLPNSAPGFPIYATVDATALTLIDQNSTSSFELNVGTQFEPKPNQKITIAISPDGRFLAAAAAETVTYGGGVKLWDIENRKLLTTFDGAGSNGNVSALAFSADGQTLAIAAGEGMQLREAVALPGVSELSRVDDLKRVSVSPDGKLLATIENQVLKFRNTNTGEVEHQREVKGLVSVLFSPDGSRYVTSARGDKGLNIELWETQSHTSVGQLPGPARDADLAFSPDGQTVAIGHKTSNCHDGCVQFLNLVSREKTTGVKTKRSDPTPVLGLVPIIFSPNGKLAVFENLTAQGHSIDLIDVTTRRSLVSIGDMSQSKYTSFGFSHDSNILAIGSDDSTVGLWDVSSLYSRSFDTSQGVNFWKVGDKQFIGLLEGHSKEITSVAFSPDGKTIASSSTDGTVRLWDTRFYQSLVTLRGYQKRVHLVMFSTDSGTLITAGDHDQRAGYSIKVWRGATNEEIALKNR